MTYVDPNPVPAAMAATPEASDHTSIKERLIPKFNLADAIKEQVELQALLKFDLPIKPLTIFEGAETTEDQQGILFSLRDYLELVDHTGRAIRDDKRSMISNDLPPILQRLGIDQSVWIENATQFEKNSRRRFAKRPRHQPSAA